ncbi:MAG TPA: TonB-dependent receptor [Cytophagales bacterium]|nr:TonB-dependent receptor [Cytophagales bacterium]
MNKLIYFAIAFFALLQVSNAQSLTQTVRGTVTDKDSKAPMYGATVMVLGSNPVNGTTTDTDGRFRLSNVPVGRQSFKVSFLGYEDIILNEISVTSGKELILNLEIVESIIMGEEVVIRPETEKENPINDMATVSARTFSVDETQRYAASVNDPGRMVSAFAGVVSSDDGTNEIVIRGNSPAGLLWRLEGLDIPNPNHFANAASSGGGISVLSSNLLANSDFMTSAFPAEYGNALSGVFDLHLRKGNNEKREFTGRIGVLGIDLAAEGPFSSKSKASYLINYRYSTLGMLGALGVNVIGDYITTFQDLSFNINVPLSQKHTISLFGIGGKSNQTSDALEDSTKWESFQNKVSSKYGTDMAAIGLTHTYFIGSRTYLKTVLGVSGNQLTNQYDTLNDSYQSIPEYNNKMSQGKFSLASTLNHKFNARHTLRTGISANELSYKVSEFRRNDADEFVRNINGSGNMLLLQGYAQWKYKMTESLSLNTGLNGMFLGLNNSAVVEPRVGIQYDLTDNQKISLGYGLHSQSQLITTYLYEVEGVNGLKSQPNKDLGFTRAHHFVIGYDRMLSDNLHLKLETYYQHLFNIPIVNNPNSNYAIINEQYSFPEDTLANKGTGKNYGVEVTFEHFLNNGFYFMLTGSLYQSKYTGGDGIERNTRFNGNYASNFLIGKEFKVGRNGKNNIFGINARLVYLGGLRYTAIDLEKSQEEDETKVDESRAYEEKAKDYFRPDLRVSYQINRKRTSHMLSLDLQNAINRENIAGQYYDKDENKIKNYYNAGLIPVLSYRIDF